MSEAEETINPENKPATEEIKPLTMQEKMNNFLLAFVPREGYFITPIIVIINILVFLIMALTGVDIMQPATDSLIEWGANYRPSTLNGEWWRLFTCCFLHIGVIHLALNMYALISIGILLEPIMKRNNFLIAYVLTGIAASAASLWWHDNTVSAGASGAIFGMYGVFLAMLTTNLIEKEERQEQLKSIGIFVVYNLVFGLKGGVDNAAHIGGLLSGIVAGYCFYFILKNPDSSGIKNVLITAFTVVVLLFSGIIYATTPNDIGTFTKAMDEFAQKEAEALTVYDLKDAGKEKLLSAITNGIKLWKENVTLLTQTIDLDIPEEFKTRNTLLIDYCKQRIVSYELNYKLVNENTSNYDLEVEESEKKIEELVKQINAL